MNNGSSGSGFFILPDQIVTCYHVIEGASSGYISPVLQPEEEYPIIGITAIDKDNDLIILRISGVSGTPLSIGNRKAEIQDQIYAVGDPLGIPGNVTDGKITNIFANRILMDANISPGNSGGAVLNTNSEVIGVVTASIGATDPKGQPIDVQNLNIAIPSKYLTPLLKKARVPNPTLKPLSVDGVTGKHLIWGGNYYEFSVCNQLAKTIWNIHFLVIFNNKKGETICADQFSETLPLYAGEDRRIIRFLTSLLTDDRYYDPGVNPEYSYSSGISGYVGPGTRQLMKSYEIRILGFDILPPHVARGPLLEGVTGNRLRWDKTDSESMRMSISYNLQNQLSKDINVNCNIVFFDEEDVPIGATIGKSVKIPAGGNQWVEDDIWSSLKQLTKRVEYRVY